MKEPHGGRVVGWFTRAWRRLGWRHVALMLLAMVLFLTLGPNGGAFLSSFKRHSDPLEDLLSGRWVLDYGFLVLAVLVADEASDDGMPTSLVYATALVFGTFVGFAVDAAISPLHLWTYPPTLLGFHFFRFFSTLLIGGVCVAAYAYHRNTQRALRGVQDAETLRVLNQQRLLSSRLLALQARVEPEFLFETLSCIGALHEVDPTSADALLTDLIALLRAMLPTGMSETSTVERELGLAAAWLRVQRQLGKHVDVTIDAEPETAQRDLAAMIVLPLLRAVLGDPGGQTRSWRLSVAAPLDRLRIELRVTGFPRRPVPVDPQAFDLAGLRERLAHLHGDDATFAIFDAQHPALAIVIDLPLTDERLAYADRTDRGGRAPARLGNPGSAGPTLA